MTPKKTVLVILASVTMLLALFWLLGAAASPVYAAPAVHAGEKPSSPTLPQAPLGTARYVAPTGSDIGGCTSAISPCRTVQYAVDQAAAGDEIHVAAGTYTDIHARNSVTQVVYISKTVTVRGGYSADFGAWDPAQYTTTLDAMGTGRVLYITGNITPTVEGLSLTHGDATGLGGGWWGDDAGGGVYIVTATAAISNCRIVSNTASYYGGGLYLWHSNATLTGNTIGGNTASASLSYGGGLYLLDSDNTTLTNNQISGNTAFHGGGLHLLDSDNTMLMNNTIVSNTASYYGGGLYLYYSGNATLTDNRVISNTASRGGGLSLYYSNNASLTGNRISGNAAFGSEDGYGGGVYLKNSDNVTLTGNQISGNIILGSDGG